DLPSLDNDDIRRGQPTIHRQFNEGYAILFGDFLVNSAFLLVLRSGFDCKKTSKILDALLESNSKLLEGQFLDITAGSDPETVAILKTANLFSGIFKSAGILVDLETEIVEILQELGLSFGALFQFEDDFRDKEKDNTAKSINNSTLLLSEFDQAVKKYKSRFAIALRNLQNLSGSNLRQFQEFVSKLDFTGIGGLGYLNNENLFRPE
ncbi:MAG: polyprenyl synthetase family protein, partial [Deltaproteobacteria bacterium]|nr:polyprenyl synthetase family protein [Deltaproteobacteria bacterium]